MFLYKRVYLCGPITGCSPQEATDWRIYVRQNLASGIVGVDPTRDKPDYIRRSEEQLSDREQFQRILHGKEVVARDRMDIANCDLVLANFLGVNQISIGSVGEIFWADAFGKPVMIVREATGNPHDHDMLNAIASWFFTNLDTAIEKINVLLTDAIKDGEYTYDS